MSLNADQIDILTDQYVIGLYQNMEADVIADVARRVKKTGRFTETAELMAKSMVEQGYNASEIQAKVFKLLGADQAYQAAVALNTKEYKTEVEQLIKDIEDEARQQGDMLVANAGTMAWNNDMQMWSEHGVDLKRPNSMSQLREAFTKQVADKLHTINQSTGFRNTALGYESILNVYQKEMDLAILKIASGTFSYDDAVKDCVHRLAQSGLRSIDYASGRSYQLDTAARMVCRTAVSQLAGKITEANIKNTGVDLVYVDAHAGARPSHAVWQGQVYYWGTPVYGYEDFEEATEYGEITGLKGVNCTHDFYPYWEGDVIPEYHEPEDVEADGETYTYYEATQEQRKMEREIRATKREIAASKALGMDTKDLNKKLSEQSKKYHSFSDQVGIRAKDNRLRVGGTNTFNVTNTKAYQIGNISYMRGNMPKGYVDTRHIGEVIEKTKLQEFAEKAKEYGIQIGDGKNFGGFETYTGKTQILMDLIEQLHNSEVYNGKVTLMYNNVLGYNGKNSVIDVWAFAETKGHTITLNKFMYDDTDYLIATYMSMVEDGFFTQGTTVVNIADHEIGHVRINNDKKIYSKVLAKVNDLAYNDGKDIISFIKQNISEYATDNDIITGTLEELLPELSAMAHGSKPGIASEILRGVGIHAD